MHAKSFVATVSCNCQPRSDALSLRITRTVLWFHSIYSHSAHAKLLQPSRCSLPPKQAVEHHRRCRVCLCFYKGVWVHLHSAGDVVNVSYTSVTVSFSLIRDLTGRFEGRFQQVLSSYTDSAYTCIWTWTDTHSCKVHEHTWHTTGIWNNQ